MLQRARQFALKEHASQAYDDMPYSYHLEAVVALLQPYGELAQVIGYLHDVVEDTDVTATTLENEFDDFVAAAVSMLTDEPTDEPGATRQQRKAKTYQKMSQVSGELEIALLVKAADRLANITASKTFNRADKLSMYRQEQPAFRAAVYRPGLCDGFWREMESVLADD